MVEMTEPHASEFRRPDPRGRRGSRHPWTGADRLGFAERTAASDAFVAREISRVDDASRELVRSPRSLRGTRAAHPRRRLLDRRQRRRHGPLAASWRRRSWWAWIRSPSASKAARVRARGHGLEPPRVTFRGCRPGSPLPFEDDSFDLVVSVSVLEFVPTASQRRDLVAEMKRVVRPGGHVFLATPSPLRLRELHSRRWFGDFVRRAGYPWATPPWDIRASPRRLRSGAHPALGRDPHAGARGRASAHGAAAARARAWRSGAAPGSACSRASPTGPGSSRRAALR